MCISDIELLANGTLLKTAQVVVETGLSEKEPYWLRENSFKLDIESIKDQDLHFLASAYREVRILGLGEITHGSHEIFEMKARIIRYCIRHWGFPQLILEADQVAAENVNTYLTTGQGNYHQALEQLSYPVFDLYKKKSGLPQQPPAVDTPFAQPPLGYHNRTGKHEMTFYDWEQFVKFANKHYGR